jgi:hypothetical protein
MTMPSGRPPPTLIIAPEPEAAAPAVVDLGPRFVEILRSARAEIARAKRILAMIDDLEEQRIDGLPKPPTR